MNRTRLLGTVLVTVFIATIFVALGFWQLDRAREFKELQKPYVEKPEIDLRSVASPGSNLDDASVNRLVRFTGRYVMQFDAPGQSDSSGTVSTWKVGLMEVDGGGAILIVRSSSTALREESEIVKGEVEVHGRLLPREVEDRAAKGDGILSRMDPALVSSLYSDPLFDGYVVARSELVDGEEIGAARVIVNPAKPRVPGYYWQHISYVVIWWLMALVVLFMPFYSRWRKRSEGGLR